MNFPLCCTKNVQHMKSTPAAIGIAFGLVTLFSVGLFFMAARKDRKILVVLIIWLVVQTALGLSGFFTRTDTVPPRLLLLPALPLLAMVALFVTRKGRAYLAGLDRQWLTLLHTVRIPVEMTLLALSIYQVVPRLMTFEGANLDILSGLTAPIVWYFGFRKRLLGRTGLLIWNIACLLLLINIVTIAILAVPSPLQRLAFEQPNVAVLYFPFVWLPGCVVPLVLFSHLAAIWQLSAGSSQRSIQPSVSAAAL